MLVTEDLAIQRRFQSVLEHEGDELLHVCATAQDAEDVLQRHTDIKVIAVDFATPGLGGLKTVARLTTARATARLVLMIHTPSFAMARQALQIGAAACVPAHLFQDALSAVLSLTTGPNDLIVLPQGALSRQKKEHGLSRRELQILALLCDGQQNKEIAHSFGIQEVTVKMHMRSVIRKLGARNRTHAAMIARDAGIV
nr:response regulator transcription factor [Aliiroseovarius sp. S1339]